MRCSVWRATTRRTEHDRRSSCSPTHSFTSHTLWLESRPQAATSKQSFPPLLGSQCPAAARLARRGLAKPASLARHCGLGHKQRARVVGGQSQGDVGVVVAGDHRGVFERQAVPVAGLEKERRAGRHHSSIQQNVSRNSVKYNSVRFYSRA
jgi:hypothetical protein